MANRVPPAFAEKLRLIMRVTGCATQKELHAKLKAVNPNTGYDPVRAYKWVQGRSSPRDLSVYDDLALLLGLEISGNELRSISVEKFHRLLSGLFSGTLPDVEHGEAQDTSYAEPVSGQPQAHPLPGYIAGRFLTISRAWSPHHPGELVLGLTTLSPAAGGGFFIDYVERLPWGDLTVSGQVLRIGRNVNAILTSEDQELVITVTYALPPAPGAVMAGVTSGSTVHDAEMRPVAGRILSVRIPDEDAHGVPGSAYLGLAPEDLAAMLETAGFRSEQAKLLAAAILEFLADPGDRGLIEAPIAKINAMIGVALSGPPDVPTSPQSPTLRVVDKGASK